MRKFLLDTNVFIWLVSEPKKVPAKILGELNHKGASRLISAVSALEIAIKVGMKKLSFPFEKFAGAVDSLGAEYLPLQLSHMQELIGLPPIHRDPFDRLLVAQARKESAVLVTSDDLLRDYGVELLALK